MNRNFETLIDSLKNNIELEKNSAYKDSIKLAGDIYHEIYAEANNNLLEYSLRLQRLIDVSFIINKYPRRFIKKGTGSQPGTQFEMAFLCLLYIPTINISVTHVDSRLITIATDGSRRDAEVTAKLEQSGNHQWMLKNMRFKSSDNRRSSRNCISEKSIIHFIVTFKVQETIFTKDLYSQSVVIIVHSSQEAEAQLTLFIDDYFRVDRLSFIEGRGFPCQSTASAAELIQSIADYFLKETGRGLTPGNCEYLFHKIKSFFQTDEILLGDFIKKSLPRIKMSFGLWIVSLIRMCKNDHINKLWQNDIIEGFVSKEVGDMLQDSGTFLLRFSERQAAIGVVMRSENNEINPWNPFTEPECRRINLANHLIDFPSLLILRKANGVLVPKSVALMDFVEEKDVDEGYTPRGAFSAQRSLEEGTPMTDDMGIRDGTDFGEDVTEDMETTANDMTMDELSDMCDILLKDDIIE